VGVPAQSELAEGFTHDPVAAALVAEQVAPPSGAFLAACSNADDDRASACYAGDPVGKTAGCQHDASVIDDHDPSATREGRKQLYKEGVGLGSTSPGGTNAHGVETCARAESKLIEKCPDRRTSAISPGRSQARAWAVRLSRNCPVAHQPCPAVSPADIEAEDSCHGVGPGSVAPSELATAVDDLAADDSCDNIELPVEHHEVGVGTGGEAAFAMFPEDLGWVERGSIEGCEQGHTCHVYCHRHGFVHRQDAPRNRLGVAG
jgi:hypothetical protein